MIAVGKERKKEMKKLFSTLLVVMLLVTTLVACGKQPPVGGGESEDSVVIGISVSLDSLEPMSAYSREEQYVIYNVFDTLIEFYDGEYQNRLAESFEMNDEMTEFTFKLREDVTFHNGEPLTANDVKYTFDNMENFPFWVSNAVYIDSTEVVDEYTVKIYATSSTAYNLVVISGTEIINEKAVTELGDAHRFAPVGTGPYKLVEYDGFSTIKLEWNPDYHLWPERGEPAIKNVTYKVIEDMQTMAMALEAGEIDFVAKVPPTDALPFENNPAFTVDWLDQDGVQLVCFNCGIEPFNDKRVRQAVAYAIDRDAINTIVAEGTGKIWDYFYSPKQAGAPDYNDLPHYTYDPEKAMELLAEAGYADGLQLDPVIIMQKDERYAVALQQQLAAVGITFELEILEQNTLFDKIFAMEYQLLPFGLSTEIYEMSYVAKHFLTLENKTMPFPCGDFGNDEINALIRLGETTSDMDERIEIYTELYKILFDEQPITAVYATQCAIVKKANLNYARPDILKIKIWDLSWNTEG